MSEPTPAHLGLDALADVASGEVDATGHLAGCPSCTSRLAELTAAEQRVTAALSGLPAPAMPDDVVQRLTAVFAAEPAPSPAPDARAASVTALPTRTARHRWLPAAAAAAVLMVTAGGLGLAFLPGSGGGDEAASVAAGAGAPDLPASASGTDYADEAAVAQALPAVLGGTAAPQVLSLDSSGSRSSGEVEAPAGGGTAETQADQRAATEMSAQQDSALTGPAPAGAAADELARLRSPEGLADCLSALLPPEEPDLRPLALDYARYQGQSALAVLLPDPDPEKVAVFVVGPRCTQQDENLLTFLRIDAP
jgi:hypothetical protein